jgi:hypothetical protein
MEFKSVKLVDVEDKSLAQKEEELLKQHEEVANDNSSAVIQDEPIPPPTTNDLKEEDVLSYIEKRYNKQISSFDELMSERKESEPMPDDVAAYMKFKKETGRGFEDFIKLNKDYDSMEGELLLKEYLTATQDGLDESDIESLLDDYRYDEDIDDESRVKKVKIERKKTIAEAKKFFNSQKEKYKLPLESSLVGIPNEEKENYEAYKQYLASAKTTEEENNRKRQWFDQKTSELFNDGFKGFEFSINDKKFKYAPGNASELKSTQSNPSNFINKFLDDKGLIKDAEGYHRSLAIAMNPERFAKYFYEQGLADATNDVTRKIKNINMSERQAPDVAKINGGIQVKAVNPDSGKGLKIRSVK